MVNAKLNRNVFNLDVRHLLSKPEHDLLFIAEENRKSHGK